MATTERAPTTDVCAIGGVDDGTLRVCCSTHQHVLCAHHYARTHFVETVPAHDYKRACNAAQQVEAEATIRHLSPRST